MAKHLVRGSSIGLGTRRVYFVVPRPLIPYLKAVKTYDIQVVFLMLLTEPVVAEAEREENKKQKRKVCCREDDDNSRRLPAFRM